MPSYDDESSLDDDSQDGNPLYNAKALERKLSKLDLDDRFGSNDLTTATTASSVTNNNSAVDLHDSNDSLYFDDAEEKKKNKKQAKKGEPAFNQGGALEMLMSPPAKKKPSASATIMLPKTMTKGKKNSDSNMSSKVASTLDKLGGGDPSSSSSKKIPTRASSSAGKDKANVNAMWDQLGKGSGHGSAKHRRRRSNPNLTDECGFIVEPGSPEALGSSSHRGDPRGGGGGGGEISRNSRRGGRRGQLGGSTHQNNPEASPGRLAQSPSARKRVSRRRRDMEQGSGHGKNSLRSSSHGPGDRDRMRSSSQGPGEPATPRTIRRAVGTPTTPGTDVMSQSAHAVETPVQRRMRRRGSGSVGPGIDMPFNSPGENAGAKESVNAADLLTPSKQVMRGRRRPSARAAGSDGLGSSQHGSTPRRSGSLRTSQHGSGGGGAIPQRSGSLRTSQHGGGGGPAPQRNSSIRSSGGRRRRSRDPALVNAEVQ